MASISTTKGKDDKPRYIVNYRDSEGRQRRKTFRRKADAEAFGYGVEADKRRGTYVDIDAGKLTFAEYATAWLSTRTFDRSTYEATELRLRVHVFPLLGNTELRRIRPSTIQGLLHSLDLAETYRRVIYVNVSAVLAAAVDDGLIATNPAAARSISRPSTARRKVTPWSSEWVGAMHEQVPARFRLAVTLGAGLGLRQGEIFGLSPSDIDLSRNEVNVQRQVKLFSSNKLTFAPPKGGKSRTVPLPSEAAEEISDHVSQFPPVCVSLPWKVPDAKDRVEIDLLLTTRERTALNRNYFNSGPWKSSRRAVGIPSARENGMHALRHWYASVLLDAGESIRAVSDYLGHADPGFTLRTYTHLMPSSAERTRVAVDAALTSSRRPPDPV